uniref:NR LBD domain-containing protein n=1 Tax=Steinernema glaseri TaxID=37863 RepID=A0A1I7ZTD8_9BILA
MKSLFNITAKKILTEKLSIDTDLLPKSALTNYEKYAKILTFRKRFSTLPAIPDECFVFDQHLRIDVTRTFKTADKIMDPVDIFLSHVELGNLGGIKPAWSRLNNQQKARVYECGDRITRFLARSYENDVIVTAVQVFALYHEAKMKNLNISYLLFTRCSLELQRLIIIDEFCNTLSSENNRWDANCRHLSRILERKDFQIEFDQIDEVTASCLKGVLRSNYSRIWMLPEKCRIREIEEWFSLDKFS